MSTSTDNLDHSNLFDIQLDHVKALREKGIAPYGHKFETNSCAHDCKEKYEEGLEVKIAGRVMLCRDMGKTKFWVLQDRSGTIQLFLNPKATEESSYELLRHLGIGDILGVQGLLFTTKTGEISIRTLKVTLLSKSLRPMPDKHKGLQDIESRFRHRYLDLIANGEARDIFQKRTKIIQSIRRYLEDGDFYEVETPMLQAQSGGATARPFLTHHNALDMNLSLRIAPELYLKRLLVGGMERVFELNRNFRNEGLSRHHNPEFTMLEVYAAYQDVESMMELCEKLIRVAGEKIGLTKEWVLPSGKVIDFEQPFHKMTLFESVQKYTDFELREESDLREIARKIELEDAENVDEGIILNELFERYVEEQLTEPTFITAYPAILCPLAKRNAQNPKLTDRFELFIDGREIANAYSELNDPLEQKARFEEQVAGIDPESGEDRNVDYEYVFALEHAMPPAGGLGIGVDRLVMSLTGATSIREVILFPLLRHDEIN